MKIKARHVLCTALTVAVLGGALGACAPLVVGGAAVATGMVATDRRTSGAQLEDQSIELKAAGAIAAAISKEAHVMVVSYNRTVLLAGEVPTEQDRLRAEQELAKIPNVRGIVNELAVLPTSSIGQRSSDTMITSKVKTAFLRDEHIPSNNVKVVTVRGVVYLMGVVSQREANRSANLARSVQGVQRVVRIFEVLPDEEIGRLSTMTPAASQTSTEADNAQ